MSRRFVGLTLTLGALVLVILAALIFYPGNAHAQVNGLKVTIFRPGEGETLYSNPSSPFAAIPITGLVSADDFDVSQLQVRLQVFQGTQVSGSATITPQTNGTFTLDVGINSHMVSDQAESEHGCDDRCHSMQSLILPAGSVLLRVTASDPLGRKAIAERSIIVEYAGYADLPVQVVVDGEPGRALAGVKVVANTRLYLWRAREFSAVTDTAGRAMIYLERLAQAPTNYIIQIEPRIVDGALITGRDPVSVTLPAGATSIDPVTLVARIQRGQIDGTIDAQGLSVSEGAADPSGLMVRAIELSTGGGHTVKVAQDKFSLTDLPLDKYLLTLDDAQATVQNIQAEPQMIDLGASPSATAILQVSTTSARTVRGVVHDTDGNPLPFAWIAADRQSRVVRVGPTSGEFVLGGLSGERVLWVTAPGYWSRPVAAGDRLDVVLNLRPGTRSIPWGPGSITVPSQTIADVSGNQISVKRGWIWGRGTGAFTVCTLDLDITVQSGSFALEYLPGEMNWLYVREGQAQVAVVDSHDTIVLSAGQMLASGKGVMYPVAVVLDDAVVRALHSGEKSQVPIETDSDLRARLTDEIERLGIPTPTAVFAALVAVLAVIGMTTWRKNIHL